MEMDDAIHEIALSIPPDQPDKLALASMLSKSWRRVITGDLFRTDYMDRHHRPPLLGYFCPGIRFVRILPQASVPYFEQPVIPAGRWTLLDSRDGLLLSIVSSTHDSLVVWDPVTGRHRLISVPPRWYQYCAGAVVCGHKDQLKGQFKVFFVGTDDVEATADEADAEGNHVNWASVYSSETSSWSDIVTLSTPAGVLQPLVDDKAPILINNVLYFTLQESEGILAYHTVSNTLSMIPLPADVLEDATEDNPGIITNISGNTLAYAYLDGDTVYIYSHVNVAAGWNLEKSITFPRLSLVLLFCSVEGTSTVFAESDDALLTINMDTYEAKQVHQPDTLSYIIPYQWYCIPGHVVKPERIVQVPREDDKFLHPSQGAIGEAEKDHEVTMSVKADNQELSIRTLSTDQLRQMDVDSKCESEDEEEEEQIVPATKGKAEPKFIEPNQSKKEVDSNEDDSDDLGEEDDRHSNDDQSDDEDEERPKKPETLKRRAVGSLPPFDKKTKVKTPSGHKPGDKGAVDVATRPAKKARETPATDEKSPKSGGSVTCDLCPMTFNSLNAQQAHWDAKHKSSTK